MNKYFENKKSDLIDYSEEEKQQYKDKLIAELKKQSAEDCIHLISDELIRNSLKNDRDVESVVWALMQ